MRVAILDDYQGVAMAMADWSPLTGMAEITIFKDHIANEDSLVDRLAPFEVLCVMRERTPLPRTLIERLPKLRFVASTGPINASIDVKAAQERGIEIAHTRYASEPTIEMTWALILAAQRHVVNEAGSIRLGGWQHTLGGDLHGRTLGLLGLGKIGGAVAKIGAAFGMRVIGWSENLTAERARAVGAEAVSKEALFCEADIVSIHTLLSHRTRNLVDAELFSVMKPAAWLVNTSRGEIVNEAAIIAILEARRIGGYAVDVFGQEPLPADHPFRSLENVLATPHLGYVSEKMYRIFYRDSVHNIFNWLKRVNP